MEQGTPAWFDIRKMHFTASNANTILARGKGLDTLIQNMLADYYSSGNYEEYSLNYMSPQMKRGKEFEDKARTIYELETGRSVKQVGFVELTSNIGCSPDGLVGDDGLIEIKNHNDKKFFDIVTTGKIEKKYIDQMQMQMYVTGRRWCDYFAFNPNFKVPYVMVKVKRDEDYMKNLKVALTEAVVKLNKAKEAIDEKFATERR